AAVVLLLKSRPPGGRQKRPRDFVGAVGVLFFVMALAFFGYVLVRYILVLRSGVAAMSLTYFFVFLVALEVKCDVPIPWWVGLIGEALSLMAAIFLMVAGWRFVARMMRDVRRPRLNRVLAVGFATAMLMPTCWLVLTVSMSVMREL